MTKISNYVEMTPFCTPIMLKMKPIMLNYDDFMLKIGKIMLTLDGVKRSFMASIGTNLPPI